MENKIWDTLENVRQGYITVNDGTQQVLELIKLVKPSQQHLPQTNVIKSVCVHVRGSIILTEGGVFAECRNCGELY